MNIHFEYHEVSASQRLEAFMTERLEKLETKYDFIINADVYFKKQNSSNPEKGKICNVRLFIPGSTIFTEASSANFEGSIAEVISELSTQLEKRKGKFKSH